MPLPTPNDDEDERHFIGRCIGILAHSGEFNDNSQRAAVCHSIWRRRNKTDGEDGEAVTHETLMAAAKSGGVEGLMIRKGLIPESVEALDGKRTIRFVISTGAVDRDNDTIDPAGWDVSSYLKNPVVLFAHDYKSLPIGRATAVEVKDGKLISECEFAEHPFAETVYQMVKGGFLRGTSVGFRPKAGGYRLNEQREGIDFTATELMEYSIVPVPSNPEALIEAKSAGIDIAPILKWAEGVIKDAKTKAIWAPEVLAESAEDLDDPIRWNRSLSKTFDVDGEPAEPSTQLYKWASRYLDTPVKDLYETGFIAGGARMGAQLSALEDLLAEQFKTEAIRNLHGSAEAPPSYETIQLNSHQSRAFLAEGTRFLTPTGVDSTKMVVRCQPSWGGIHVAFFAPLARAGVVGRFITDVYTRAASFKFLKGEAFALSGEFLHRGTETWGDLFLDSKVEEPIRRTAALLAEQGKEMDPRGVILMGPPGTGKTLAGRILMNDAKEATFIWCSSRDFYRAGMFGGIELAYDLAEENAPSVIFIEDIDSWWDDTTIDLLKTELDGLKQKKGIVTILTTNHPEQLPEALIDRPGRFHDVLNLALPDKPCRRRMLDKWVPEASEETRESIAEATDGLSGAHLRELVRFAETIQSQDRIELGIALQQALAKVQEQRDTISACRARRPFKTVKMFAATFAKAPLAADHPESGGALPDTCKPDGGKCPDGYGMGADGMCHLAAPKKEPNAVCRICHRELEIAMPRLKDELGVVCAACFVRAATPEPTAVAPAVVQTTAELVLDLDNVPCADVVVELEDGDGDEVVVDVGPEQIREALRGAITSTVTAIVREETRAAFDRARGRVD